MKDKPTRAADYGPEHLEHVTATCLHVATLLGDLADDLVVVGGLVPALLLARVGVPRPADRHVGTADLDVGLSLGLLGTTRYQEVARPDSAGPASVRTSTWPGSRRSSGGRPSAPLA
ncbi:MAG: hypothetical protein HY722_01205 [Planctomycetes bacterium]|nr:hypothetical protein [Planctomycetota bacterium]